MERRGTGFFITAIVFAAIATVIFAYFLTVNLAIFVPEAEDAGEALGKVVGIILFFPIWIIAGGISGIVSAVFSGIGIRYTKWSILLLVLSVLYIAAPFIFILIAGNGGGSEEPAVQSAMCGYMSFIC